MCYFGQTWSAESFVDFSQRLCCARIRHTDRSLCLLRRSLHICEVSQERGFVREWPPSLTALDCVLLTETMSPS